MVTVYELSIQALSLPRALVRILTVVAGRWLELSMLTRSERLVWPMALPWFSLEVIVWAKDLVMEYKSNTAQALSVPDNCNFLRSLNSAVHHPITNPDIATTIIDVIVKASICYLPTSQKSHNENRCRPVDGARLSKDRARSFCGLLRAWEEGT